MAEHTMSLDEVAEELRRSPATLRRSWRRLHQLHGFPRPLPGAGLVWSRALVVAWIRGASAASGRPANDDALAGADAARLLEAYRQGLRAEIGR